MTGDAKYSNGQMITRNAVVGIVAAALGSTGGVFGYMKLDPPRQDPFTGADGTEMRRQITEGYRREVTLLSDRMSGIETRAASIEAEDRALERMVNEILIEIGQLPPDEFEDRVRALELWRARHEAQKRNGE